jgi:hypothetical protein
MGLGAARTCTYFFAEAAALARCSVLPDLKSPGFRLLKSLKGQRKKRTRIAGVVMRGVARLKQAQFIGELDSVHIRVNNDVAPQHQLAGVW